MSEQEIPIANPIDALILAFSKVQGELSNPSKDKKGQFGMYASLEGLLEQIRPLLAKHGLALWQYPQEAVVITEILHKDGGRMSFTYPLIRNDNKNAVFAMGGAFTYARRYALCGIFGLQGDDIDEEDVSFGKKSKASPELDAVIANAEKASPVQEPNLADVAAKMQKSHKNLRVNDLAWMDDPSFEDFIYETAKEKNLSQEDVRLHALKNPEHARQVFTRWKGAPSD